MRTAITELTERIIGEVQCQKSTTTRCASAVPRILVVLRPGKLNFYTIRVEKEEDDADFGAAANWPQLFETKLIHCLHHCRQIFHVKINPVDTQMIDRWRLRKRIVEWAPPLPQLNRRSISASTETDIFAFEVDGAR